VIPERLANKRFSRDLSHDCIVQNEYFQKP
jgi:hypothetical protein